MLKNVTLPVPAAGATQFMVTVVLMVLLACVMPPLQPDITLITAAWPLGTVIVPARVEKKLVPGSPRKPAMMKPLKLPVFAASRT